VAAAREEILGRVCAALGDDRQRTAAPTRSRRAGSLDERARIDLFAERVADYRAEVHRNIALEEVAVGLGALAVPSDLPDTLTPTELDHIHGIVTGCAVAIAETGTIILSGAPHEGRRALSLVPDLHVCIVEASQIVQTVPEAFDRLAPFATRPLTFISGPSATSDIELRRVEGVHGPRRLIVVIVAEA
jgi:L-lactate dehydrogenase complex protein LldG